MTAVNIKISKKIFNNVYLENNILQNKDRYLVMYGGAGSGKSVMAAQKMLYRMLTETPHRFLVVRKVARTLRNSVYSLFKDLIIQWGMSELFKINKTEMTITCINGNQIIFTGLDDVEKLKSIAGITGMWLEETSECLQSDVQQLDLRLRGKTKHYKQIMITFNPISEHHWLKKSFFDTPRESCTILKTTYLDNKFIDDEYKKVLEDLKTQDENYYNIYALGQWGSLGNMVYSNYAVEPISEKDHDYDAVYYGLDFGFNHASALIKVGIRDDEIYILDEIYEKRLTNAELIEKVKKKVPLNAWIYADSAEPDRIKEFRISGFGRIQPVEKGPNSVKSGIDFLRRKKVHINPACVNFIKEIQSYKYKEDKDGNVFEEPVNFNDDCMAAWRYSIEQYRKTFERTNIGITKARLGL